MADAENNKRAEAAENENQQDQKQIEEQVKKTIDELKARSRESLEAMREGKGRMKLEKPIKSGDTEIEELAYDFTTMTGLDFTIAMDSDMNARDAFRITYRQGLALFATAAAKHTGHIDSKTIIENIGMTDAVEGVQLATSFFVAAARAGRMRISKM